MNDNIGNKLRCYYVSLSTGDDFIFHAYSWDSILLYLLDYVGCGDEHIKSIISQVKDIKEKIIVFEKFTDETIRFSGIMSIIYSADNDDYSLAVVYLDTNGNEIEQGE